MSLPQVKAQLAAALRDYVVNGVPASGPNDVAKLAFRAALMALADLTVSSGTTLVFATVPDLEASANPETVGARAEVRADPAGNVEDGNGVWSWAGVGPGWVWISDLVPAGLVDAVIAEVPQPVVDCVITNIGNLATYTPKPGYTVVPGSGQIFTGKSSFTNTGNIYAVVVGELGLEDPRQIVPPGALELPAGAIREGDAAPLMFNGTRLILQVPMPVAAPPAPAVVGQAVVWCDASADGPSLDLAPADTFTITPATVQILAGVSPMTNTGAVYADLDAITGGDYREVVFPDGSELTPGAIVEDGLFILVYNAAGSWTLMFPPAPYADARGDHFTAWAAAGAAAVAFNGSF